MDNLEKALSILFRRVSAQEIIEKKEKLTTIECNEFVQLLRSYSDRYSETELRLMYRTFVLKIKEKHMGGDNFTVDVFSLLAVYASWILTLQDDEIVVPYMKLFHWRNITFELDEDILSTCFLAVSGIEPSQLHDMYAWKSTLTHNNRELHRILNQGIAENHSHLKGAAVLFPLTWISIVNIPEQLDKDTADGGKNYLRIIREIDENRRNTNHNYKLDFREIPLRDQIIKAAAIRLLLISFLNKNILTNMERDILQGIIDKPYEPVLLQSAFPKPESLFGQLRTLISKARKMGMWNEREYASDKNENPDQDEIEQRIDYASNGLKSEKEIYESTSQLRMHESIELYGERWFLYSMFKKLFSNEKDEQIENNRHLFYAYLVIKENFRAEFVQINSSVGFENFMEYEKRKDLLFDNQSFFEKKQVENAVKESLFGSNIVTYEARIAPKKGYEAMKSNIESLDDKIGSDIDFRNRYYYTIHFIKEQDDDYKKLYEGAVKQEIQCRHSKLRADCKEKAESIVAIRNADFEIAQRIRGIDAANMEIGCGPEVFAQVFRYLGDHSAKYKNGHKTPQLRKTYHVGEDYLDMISGLRAIDEALHFLGMTCGDRLGHAMVLGRDVNEWYFGKGKRVLLPMQEYLDNLAWMHHLLIVHPSVDRVHLEDYIRKEYGYYFHMVYGRYIKNEDVSSILKAATERYENTEYEQFYRETLLQYDIETYYAAWKLRGDNPECYKNGYFDDVSPRGGEKTYSSYNVNSRATKRPAKRYISSVAMLYYYYHYNMDVRREGSKPIEVVVSDEYIECVKFIQSILQKKIAATGICIETNPSSNFKISNLGLYEKHPIFKFYNRQLVDKDEELTACPQLNVSINTDDAGIFATSLENEYAYLALALEKAKGANGLPKYKKKNIYAWINDIREMGLRQTFLDDSSMKEAFREWGQRKDNNNIKESGEETVKRPDLTSMFMSGTNNKKTAVSEFEENKKG